MPGTVKLIRFDDRPQLHVVCVTISHRSGNEEECGYGLASNPVVRLSAGLRALVGLANCGGAAVVRMSREKFTKPTVIVGGAYNHGVGKTTLARTLLDYLSRKNVLARCYDTEWPRGRLKRFYPIITSQSTRHVHVGHQDERARRASAQTREPQRSGVVDLKRRQPLDGARQLLRSHRGARRGQELENPPSASSMSSAPRTASLEEIGGHCQIHPGHRLCDCQEFHQ